jgi:hypothetical protein
MSESPESFEQPTVRITIKIDPINNLVIVLFYGLQHLCFCSSVLPKPRPVCPDEAFRGGGSPTQNAERR